MACAQSVGECKSLVFHSCRRFLLESSTRSARWTGREAIMSRVARRHAILYKTRATLVPVITIPLPLHRFCILSARASSDSKKCFGVERVLVTLWTGTISSTVDKRQVCNTAQNKSGSHEIAGYEIPDSGGPNRTPKLSIFRRYRERVFIVSWTLAARGTARQHKTRWLSATPASTTCTSFTPILPALVKMKSNKLLLIWVELLTCWVRPRSRVVWSRRWSKYEPLAPGVL